MFFYIVAKCDVICKSWVLSKFYLSRSVQPALLWLCSWSATLHFSFRWLRILSQRAQHNLGLICKALQQSKSILALIPKTQKRQSNKYGTQINWIDGPWCLPGQPIKDGEGNDNCWKVWWCQGHLFSCPKLTCVFQDRR